MAIPKASSLGNGVDLFRQRILATPMSRLDTVFFHSHEGDGSASVRPPLRKGTQRPALHFAQRMTDGRRPLLHLSAPVANGRAS